MHSINNSVRLIGRLGADPEIRQIGDDKKVAHFSMATHEIHHDAEGNKVTRTCWHSLTAWNLQARLAEQYLYKGQEIAIEGKLNSHAYTDKEGNRKNILEIVVNEIMFLGTGPDLPPQEPAF